MILIIGAMDEEVSALSEISRNPQSFVFEDIEVTVADMGSEKIMIAKSGIGKATAAYTASILCSHFRPSVLINIGSAGGLQEGQQTGDVVLSASCRFHDLDIGPDTPTDERFLFIPSEKYVVLAEEILNQLEIRYHKGLIVTGDQFLTKDLPAYLRVKKHFSQAICAEMEAAAIASVCSRNKTPFIVLRGISDLIFTEGNEVDFMKYLEKASKTSAQICKAFVERINELG